MLLHTYATLFRCSVVCGEHSFFGMGQSLLLSSCLGVFPDKAVLVGQFSRAPKGQVALSRATCGCALSSSQWIVGDNRKLTETTVRQNRPCLVAQVFTDSAARRNRPGERDRAAFKVGSNCWSMLSKIPERRNRDYVKNRPSRLTR